MEVQQTVRVTQLWYYPVKSMGAVKLDRAPLTVPGFPFDRQFMVVNDEGNFITQRQIPKMSVVSPQVTEQVLRLSMSGMPDLTIDIPEALSVGKRRQVKVFSSVCFGIELGETAHAWLMAALATPSMTGGLQLVCFDKSTPREVSAKYQKGENSHTYFADGYPYLVTNEATLAKVNDALADDLLDAVPMSRFRPNIVVSGAPAFDEFSWDELRLPEKDIALGCRKPCQRCEIITVDQASGVIPKKGRPLGALVKLNPLKSRGKKGGYFGVNCTLLSGDEAVLSVGDELQVVGAES